MTALLDAARYAAATARVRARAGRLLDARTWRRLLDASDTRGVAGALAGTPYEAALSSVTERTPTAVDIERAARRHLARSYRAPVPFARGRVRSLLDWLWRRFELENLRAVLRGVSAGQPRARVEPALVPLDPGLTLDWRALADSSSVGAIVPALRRANRPRFADALAGALERHGRRPEPGLLEIALDLAWHRRLLRLAGALRGEDARAARTFVTGRIDAFNVVWALRYRHSFGLPPEAIVNFTLQRHLRVDAARLRRIAAGATPAAAAAWLWGAGAPEVERLERLEPRPALAELERMAWRRLQNRAVTTLAGNAIGLAGTLAYETLVEAEVLDLVATAEGKAAGWPTERLRERLVGARA